MISRRVARVVASVLGLAALMAGAALADPPIINHNNCFDMPFIIPSPPPPAGEPTAILRFEPPFGEVGYRPSCAGNFAVYNDIWVEFQAEATAYEVNLCGPSTAVIPDLIATAYHYANPASPCTSRVEAACIDNSPLCGESPTHPGLLPRIELYNLIVGHRYALQFMIRGYAASACDQPPCSQGDYTLSIHAIDPPACFLNVPPSVPDEGEFVPCSTATRVNDGCDQWPPAFSQIALGETRHGTSSNDGVSRDADWFRVFIQQPGTLLTTKLYGEFDAEMRIVAAAPDQPCEQSTVAEVTYAECEPERSLTAFVDAGEHFILVQPAATARLMGCENERRNYRLMVTGSPGAPATGACCQGVACVEMTKAACDAAACHYYGDGTTCGGISCYVRPMPAVDENESMNCPAHGHSNTFNGGCEFSASALTFSNLTVGQPRAGVTGTMFNAPPPAASANQRDSDWYWFSLSGVPVGELRNVVIDVHTEFPAQVLIINPLLGSSPCATWQSNVVTDAYVPPGVPTVVQGCVLKRPGIPFFREVWIVIRPAWIGTPREIPCGVRYVFTADVMPCSPVLCIGDTNCDGEVNFFDIDRFVEALGYPGGANWPHACPWLNGDCDADNDVDFFDIDPFVARLGAMCP